MKRNYRLGYHGPMDQDIMDFFCVCTCHEGHEATTQGHATIPPIPRRASTGCSQHMHRHSPCGTHAGWFQRLGICCGEVGYATSMGTPLQLMESSCCTEMASWFAERSKLRASGKKQKSANTAWWCCKISLRGTEIFLRGKYELGETTIQPPPVVEI